MTFLNVWIFFHTTMKFTMSCSYNKINFVGAILRRKAQKFKNDWYFKKQAEKKLTN